MKLNETYFEVRLSQLDDPTFDRLAILRKICMDAAEEQRGRCYSHCDNHKSHTCFRCDKNIDSKCLTA
jgi:hypothetical protein